MKTLAQIYAEMNKDPDNRLTNKGDFEHGGYFRCHVDLYEEILAPYRQTATRVFEIGINKGGSIRMWKEYFPEATIFGLDSSKGVVRNMQAAKVDRVTALRLNQNDRDQLQDFADTYGLHAWEKFVIGIDDGSHYWEDQIKSFQVLWPTIKDGGLYVCEDTLNSYYTKAGNDGQSAIDYFKGLVNELNFHGDSDVSSPTEYQSTIGWIGFRYNVIFIKKQLVAHVT